VSRRSTRAAGVEYDEEGVRIHTPEPDAREIADRPAPFFRTLVRREGTRVGVPGAPKGYGDAWETAMPALSAQP
jgi:hypothetical protein